MRELIDIDGIDDYTRRMQGINIASGGSTNAVEFCTTMLGFPQLTELLADFVSPNHA